MWFLYGNKLSGHLCKYQELWLLCYMVRHFPCKLIYCLPWWLYYFFFILLGMSERSDCSSWCLMVSVIWICALGTGVSNTFSDTSVCRLSHWSISAQVFCPLCRWAFFFLFLNWKGSLYILNSCSSLAGTFANTSPCLPFSESFFCSAEVSYFNEVQPGNHLSWMHLWSCV